MTPGNAELSVGTRRLIWLQTLGAVTAILVVTVLAEWALFSSYPYTYALRLSAALAVTQLSIAVAIPTGLGVHKIIERRERRNARRVAPDTRAALTAHALGIARWPELSRRFRHHPRIFQRVLFEMLSVLRGAPQIRLVLTAERLGLSGRWIAATRSRRLQTKLRGIRALGFIPTDESRRILRRFLKSKRSELQVAAADALVRQGYPEDLARVFEIATGRSSIWSHAVLGETMRIHAEFLSRRAIPRALASDNVAQVATVLRLVYHWGVRLEPRVVTLLLEHAEAKVRVLAFHVLPQVDRFPDAYTALKRGLCDPSADVRSAAATVAGRLRMVALAPELTRCLSEANSELRLAAATAVASLGRRYLPVLETVAKRGDDATARLIGEVVERSRMGRLQCAIG